MVNAGWLFAVICILILFWSVEVRFKELYKRLNEIKDVTNKSMDKTTLIEKQLNDWKQFLK